MSSVSDPDVSGVSDEEPVKKRDKQVSVVKQEEDSKSFDENQSDGKNLIDLKARAHNWLLPLFLISTDWEFPETLWSYHDEGNKLTVMVRALALRQYRLGSILSSTLYEFVRFLFSFFLACVQTTALF